MAGRIEMAALRAIFLTVFLSACVPDNANPPPATSPGAAQPNAPTVWIGVSLASVEFPPSAATDGMSGGARIDFTTPGSPADVSGLREDDIILRFDGLPTRTVEDLVKAVNTGAPRNAPVTLLRDGQKLTFDVSVETRPADANDIVKKSLSARITDEQKVAAEAKSAGEFKTAFNHYVKAQRLLIHDNASYGTDTTDIINFDIAQVAEMLPKLRSPPSFPAEAERHNRRAIAILQNATTEEDYDRAAGEFALAIKEAPWVADLYLNRGLVLAKAGYPEGAMTALRRYLTLNPAATDASDIRQKMAELDVLAEERKPWYPFLRSWQMEKGNEEAFDLRDRRLTLSVVKASATLPLKVGDVLCSGTIRGRQFQGKCTLNYSDPNSVKCFGPKEVVDADGAIDAANKLTIRIFSSNFKTSTCQIVSQQWITWRTF